MRKRKVIQIRSGNSEIRDGSDCWNNKTLDDYTKFWKIGEKHSLILNLRLNLNLLNIKYTTISMWQTHETGFDKVKKSQMLTMDPQLWSLNMQHYLGTSTFSELCEEYLLSLLMWSCESRASFSSTCVTTLRNTASRRRGYRDCWRGIVVVALMGVVKAYGVTTVVTGLAMWGKTVAGLSADMGNIISLLQIAFCNFGTDNSS